MVVFYTAVSSFQRNGSLSSKNLGEDRRAMKNYSRIDFEERVKIETYLGEKFSISAIAKRLKRSKSTISRELRRPVGRYVSYTAEFSAKRRARFRRRERKITLYPKLREQVLIGLRKRWSPKQISMVLQMNYPKDKTMQISHEAIYSFIYVLARGELKKELISYLRQKKKRRYSRLDKRKKRTFGDMISIEERPRKVAKRSLAGDWEGDLILGKGLKSAIGTLVERKVEMKGKSK